MKLKHLLGIGAVVVVMHVAAPQTVMPASFAQTIIHSTDWTSGGVGSTVAGAAGTTTGAGDGWIDNAGGVATAGSAAHLTITAGTSPWTAGTVLLRPAAENVRDERVIQSFPRPASVGNGPSVILRWQGANTDYFCTVVFNAGTSTLAEYRNASGTFTQVGTTQSFTTPAAGDAMVLTCDAVGASPTTLTETLRDTTTSTTLVNTYAVTDSTGPQTAGQMGLSGYGTLSVNQTQTYTLAPVAIGVSAAAWRFSPSNWAGDTGRGGSVYRQTWNNGAYATCYWTASASPTATLNVSNQTTGSFISYVLNGVLHDNIAVPASGGIVVSGITASAANALTLYCRNSSQSARWNEANGYKITDLSVDAASTAGTAPAWNGKWVMEIGDSISEGINADAAGNPNSLTGYTYLVGQSLLQQGYDYGVSACGFSGWIQTGDGYGTGDVPRYYSVSGGTYQGDSVSRWNQIDSTTSLLDANGHISAYGVIGQEPVAITFNYGTNEVLSSLSASDMRLAVTGALTKVRAAAPNAQMIVYVPFNLYAVSITGYSGSAAYITALKGGVTDYQAANPLDSKIKLVDFGSGLALTLQSLTNAVHPNAAGHALIAADAAGAVLSKLSATGTKRRLQ